MKMYGNEAQQKFSYYDIFDDECTPNSITNWVEK